MTDDDDTIDLLDGTGIPDGTDGEDDGADGETNADRSAEERRERNADAGARSGPLGELADRLGESDREAIDAAEETFSEIDTEEVDVEDVWEEIEHGTEPAGEAVGDNEAVRRVSKALCHGCPHFGDPPELHCTHDGTTIREMPDEEHFVVVECPVVEEQGDEL